MVKTKSKFKDHGNDEDFGYKTRTEEQYAARENQSGGSYDPTFKQEAKFFKPHAGDNRIRILPALGTDNEHWGVNVFMHSNVGAENARYICPYQHGGKQCAVCDEVARMRARAKVMTDKGKKELGKRIGDAAYEISARKRVAVWLIDRADEKAGVLLWAMPWKTDRDFAKKCKDRESGQYVPIDHPTKGRDIFFEKHGELRGTEYLNIDIGKGDAPVSEEPVRMKKWLKFVKDHPLGDMIIVADPKKLARVFAPDGASEDGGKPAKKMKKKHREEEAEKPAEATGKVKKLKKKDKGEKHAPKSLDELDKPAKSGKVKTKKKRDVDADIPF